jgi:DNA-binding MarR family transcriptional regulator
MSSQKNPSRRDELLAALIQELRNQSTRTILLHQAIADRLGLSPTDHKCLNFIIGMEPLTAGQLAELTGLTTGAVTGVIDRLEKAGFVRRLMDPNDRRRVIIEPIPEKAEREIAPLFASLARATEELCSKYNEQELALLLDFLTAANQVAEQETAKLREQANPAPKNKPSNGK